MSTKRGCGKIEKDARALPEAHRRSRAATRRDGRRRQLRKRVLAVQLVELHEILGELVAELHLVIRQIPLGTRLAAGLHLDLERLAPGVAGCVLGDLLHQAARAKCRLKDIELAFRLVEYDLVLRRRLIGGTLKGL